MFFFKKLINTIKIIQIVFNNKTNKIEENFNSNIIETYHHNNSNSRNNSNRFKLINFFINNRSDYSKQITKAVMIRSSIFINTKIGNILSLLMETYNYNNSNSSNNFRRSKHISFIINDN